MAAKNHVFLSECQTTLRLHKIHAVADRESRAAPQAGAIPPWPSPHRTKPPAISFTTSGRQVGVSCIIKCPVTRVNPNIFCSLTRVRFGAPAFVYRPGFPSCERDREASPGGCGHGDVKVTFRPGPWEPPPLERIGWRPTK